MKIKLGFVTNSSSTAYLITNTSSETKTLVDFVLENPQLIEQFVDEYDWHKGDPMFTQIMLVKSAKKHNIIFESQDTKYCTFGDEDGTLIGQVFDYILRDGGSSENFTWQFYEALR